MQGKTIARQGDMLITCHVMVDVDLDPLAEVVSAGIRGCAVTLPLPRLCSVSAFLSLSGLAQVSSGFFIALHSGGPC